MSKIVCMHVCMCALATVRACKVFIFVHSDTNTLNNPKDYFPHESSIAVHYRLTRLIQCDYKLIQNYVLKNKTVTIMELYYAYE